MRRIIGRSDVQQLAKTAYPYRSTPRKTDLWSAAYEYVVVFGARTLAHQERRRVRYRKELRDILPQGFIGRAEAVALLPA